MPRDVKLVIKINEQMKEKFQAQAESIGMTMSALGAYLIGQYIKQQETVITPMNEKLIDAIKEAVRDTASDSMENAIMDEETMAAMLSQFQRMMKKK